MAYNCLDRHVANGLGDRPCLLWEGNEPGSDKVLTYSQVLEQVSRLVSILLHASSALHSTRRRRFVACMSDQQLALLMALDT